MANTNVLLGLSNIFVGVLIIAVCIPLLKYKVKMNHWYGIRFKKSFESTENWYKINRYGARRMIPWSVLIVVIGILTLFVPVGDNVGLRLAIIHAPLIIFIPIIQTWLFVRKL
ncbi:MAG: SdpI family protein [Candidatus Lindowbacteria bacterium]|nr:SdpI family protein [Candidatus Lindowbacteria bacterium]